jgi:hypothetical protein
VLRRSLRVAMIALLAGCGADGDGRALATSESRATCQDAPGAPGDPDVACVEEVVGRVHDGSDRPLRVPVSVCGLACFAGTVDESGAFRVPVGARLPAGGYVLFAHGRPRHASQLIPLPAAPGATIDLAAIELASFPEEAARLPADGDPATTLEVGALRLGVPSGTTWDLAFEDLADDAEGRSVRVARVPAVRAPAFAAGAVLVYALAPFMAKPSVPVSVVLRETGGLPPLTAVDLVVMQDGITAAENTGGRPLVAATGHVSADGGQIETDPGQGIAVLTWLAVRPRP